MSELCKDLTLTIHKEPDPDGNGERVRIQLANPLEMMEIEECYPITAITKKTSQSNRYYIKEAVVIALRRLVSEAFRQDMITDALGGWTISSPPITGSSSGKSEIELEL